MSHKATRFSCLNSLNVTLNTHQKKVAVHLMSNRGVLAYWSTGAGKTLCAAAAAVCLFRAGIVSRVIILTKKSALEQFREEVRRFWPKVSEFEDKFLYSTFHTFFRSEQSPENALLVVDEAHEFTSLNAAATNKMVKFAHRCKKVLLLTATPYVNDIYDFAPLMAMVKGDAVISRKTFYAMVGDPAKFKSWLKNSISFQVIDKSKSKDFAKVLFHLISIPMNQLTWKTYQKKLRLSGKNKKPFYMDLRALSMSASPSKCEKCDWIETHVSEWIKKKEGKIVIYTSFLDTGVRAIERALIKAKASFSIIDGSKSAAKRREIVKLFNRPIPTKKDTAERRLHHKDLGALVSEEFTKPHKRKGVSVCSNRVWFERTAHRKEGGYTFSYFKDGKRVTSKPLIKKFEDHVADYPIPPAWSPAYVCEPNQKIQWMTKDLSGKWQRRYSKDWNDQQEFLKVLRLKRLTRKFWNMFHARVHRDMKSSNALTKLCATATALMEASRFRPGWMNTREGKETHYGISTLQKRHVTYKTKAFYFEFLGKSSKINRTIIREKDHPNLYHTLYEIFNQGKRHKNAEPFWNWRSTTLTQTAFKRYLKELGIRAKDFRTYFANFTLLDMLKGRRFDGQRADEVTESKRKRALGEVYREVAKGLNNTPAVSKSSYIFSGLTVLYLKDPVLFLTVVDQNEGEGTASLLSRFVKLFDTERIDWREMLKEAEASSRNMEVVVITDAGAESMDLKGVRHIVIVDPTWTDALRKQIIGRGQRYKSHTHLPKAKQTINVWELFLDVPKYAKVKESADRIVARFAKQKEKELEEMKQIIAEISI